MNILADENIPLVVSAFSTIGDVHTIEGRNITPQDLTDIDILLVRSVTKVDKQLLKGSKVCFVGTATIGFDHIDLDYLRQNNIGFASAPGCNANSAAEYVISTLLVLGQQNNFELRDKTVGIIGCGNVGSNVLQKLQALGVHCLVNDPPLQAAQNNTETFVDLETVLQADIVTLHVPLEKSGLYPTYHLVNQTFLHQLTDDTILLNISRGDVVDESAMAYSLINRPQLSVVLDVWPHEPSINPFLMQKAIIATPHIAGYSLDGKLRGTEMLYIAVCQYFQHTASWQAKDYLPQPNVTELHFSEQTSETEALLMAVTACYDVRQDDALLRQMLHHPNPAIYFDQLRKTYPVRREFSSLKIKLSANQQGLQKKFKMLGFSVD
ncbi:4-phosphoerythronate dehydrogenase PdxB [Candidatus Albibeggiatoa sp. nov. BB20]|uniref:4-phosphoerythronate dehydrogenase PdxB n=1 Tax=Candidatus Albibeggiatoa sp. nov. BB20 TaxID=3162723 RepID=UPI0033654C8F